MSFQVHGHHPPPEAPSVLHLYKGCDCPDLDCSNITGFPSVLLQHDTVLQPQNGVHGQLAWRLWWNTSTEVRQVNIAANTVCKMDAVTANRCMRTLMQISTQNAIIMNRSKYLGLSIMYLVQTDGSSLNPLYGKTSGRKCIYSWLTGLLLMAVLFLHF